MAGETSFFRSLKPGRRADLWLPAPPADALAIAELLTPEFASPLAVITAEAADAARLCQEIAWLRPQRRCRLLPDWETLPYDPFSPPKELISERLACLYALSQGEVDVLVTSLQAAQRRMPPPSYLAAYTFSLKRGQRLDADSLRRQLDTAGYVAVQMVLSPGEYAVRGGLIDLYPMGEALPIRLDLFGDDLESLKVFDPTTQRSLYPIAELSLCPAHEFPINERGRTLFRQQFRARFEGDPSRSRVYKQISDGMVPAGIEYYLPLFFDETADLFAYLNPDTALVTHGAIEPALTSLWQANRQRFDLVNGDRSQPVMPPEALWLTDDDWWLGLRRFSRRQIGFLPPGNESVVGTEITSSERYRLPPPVALSRSHGLGALNAELDAAKGPVLLLAESDGRREIIKQLLTEHGLRPELVGDASAALAPWLDGGQATLPRFALAVAPLCRGLIWQPATEPLTLLSEAELYAETPRRRGVSRPTAHPDHWLRDLSELASGDPVVHEVHGIGRYAGLVHLDLGDGDVELLEIHYANDSKLYVPVAQLHVISRYSGADAEQAPLHQLGSGQWEKAQKKAALEAYDTAAELLTLYALRASRQGHAFVFDEQDYQAFADGFGFTETQDQAAAIDVVLADMRSPQPMDRLVCGDVGFGKTEVALRAAFCAVAGGKQVAVLTPTTLLCEQHYTTFCDRFADWPVLVAELSRFNTGKTSRQVLDQLAAGRIDIVIGTHKLLQDSVRFQRLGLVIIDEEHRFGVRQKEQLKRLRAEVDVLTLTATPIPRTLAISLEGLRSFSVIATPPDKRLPIKTFVAQESDAMIREALWRELKRGGQVYYLYNEVSTIDNMRERLQHLVPEARILVGHGQMHERDLERVMRDFSAQRANVLLCTTIIETGIDNPHANTILIHRADRFGLAQLHQLRGRVGRSHHQAYAYLLVHDERGLSKTAKARLDALQAMEELGSGFYLAMHDMEIRGVGTILGDNQAGDVQAVGFNRYHELLQQAIKHLKQGDTVEADLLTRPLHQVCDIQLHEPALLPSAYCPDVQERLNLYKTLADCDDEAAIDEVQEALIDRFGPLPPQAEALLTTHRMRLLLEPLAISRLDATASRLIVSFGPQPRIDPANLVTCIQLDRRFSLKGKDKLQFTESSSNLGERLAALKRMLSRLTTPATTWASTKKQQVS